MWVKSEGSARQCYDRCTGLGAGHLQFEINNPRQNSGPYPGALEGARKLLPLELGTHTFRILAPDRESQGFGNIGVIVP